MPEKHSSGTPDWTLPLGRWGQTPVRLHLLFILVVIGTLYLSWLAGQREMIGNSVWLASLAIVVATLSAAVHVAAHIYAATQFHVSVSPMVIGPHGDFAESLSPAETKTQLAIALAGPGVNLLIAMVCIPGVVAASESPAWPLLNPISPQGLLTGTAWLVALKLTFWINWTLALLNLLPARPFDGGQVMLAISNWFYPHASRRRIERFVSRVGVCTGFGLLLAAIFVRDFTTAGLVPAWAIFLILGAVVLFSPQSVAQRILAERPSGNELFGYDFSQGYTSMERSHARVDEADDDGPLERWMETRKQQRRQRQQELEAEEDELVDEILARVHELGLDGLTPEERAILHRVSMRYRTRIDPS